MRLKDFKIIPGVVIDVSDPKYIGRVKADSPGLFNSEVMSKEGLPWIYPFSMTGYQGFSKLRTGSKIWILTNDEYHEFWYWPMFELNSDTRDIISANESDYEESEVLLSRNNGDNGVYIYYSPSEGIVIQNTENTFIKIKSNNEIEIKAGKGNVLIKDNIVYLGNEDGEYTQAVLGNKLDELLSLLFSYLKTLHSGLLTNPYTSAAASAASPQYTILSQNESFMNPKKLLSDKVKLN